MATTLYDPGSIFADVPRLIIFRSAAELKTWCQNLPSDEIKIVSFVASQADSKKRPVLGSPQIYETTPVMYVVSLIPLVAVLVVQAPLAALASRLVRMIAVLPSTDANTSPLKSSP